MVYNILSGIRSFVLEKTNESLYQKFYEFIKKMENKSCFL